MNTDIDGVLLDQINLGTFDAKTSIGFLQSNPARAGRHPTGGHMRVVVMGQRFNGQT
jgi:hypothetical protein